MSDEMTGLGIGTVIKFLSLRTRHQWLIAHELGAPADLQFSDEDFIMGVFDHAVKTNAVSELRSLTNKYIEQQKAKK